MKDCKAIHAMGKLSDFQTKKGEGEIYLLNLVYWSGLSLFVAVFIIAFTVQSITSFL